MVYVVCLQKKHPKSVVNIDFVDEIHFFEFSSNNYLKKTILNRPLRHIKYPKKELR